MITAPATASSHPGYSILLAVLGRVLVHHADRMRGPLFLAPSIPLPLLLSDLSSSSSYLAGRSCWPCGCRPPAASPHEDESTDCRANERAATRRQERKEQAWEGTMEGREERMNEPSFSSSTTLTISPSSCTRSISG